MFLQFLDIFILYAFLCVDDIMREPHYNFLDWSVFQQGTESMLSALENQGMWNINLMNATFKDQKEEPNVVL